MGPERFARLHDEARRLLDALEGSFDVVRVGAHPGSRPDWQGDLPATVEIAPTDPGAAPLRIAFTPFPGLMFRAGLWYDEAIPACGCDACDESPESAADRLLWLAEQVTAGRFSERIRVPPLLGSATFIATFGDPATRMERRRTRIPRQEGRRRLAARGRGHDWQPWPLRSTSA